MVNTLTASESPQLLLKALLARATVYGDASYKDCANEGQIPTPLIGWLFGIVVQCYAVSGRDHVA